MSTRTYPKPETGIKRVYGTGNGEASTGYIPFLGGLRFVWRKAIPREA